MKREVRGIIRGAVVLNLPDAGETFLITYVDQSVKARVVRKIISEKECLLEFIFEIDLGFDELHLTPIDNWYEGLFKELEDQL